MPTDLINPIKIEEPGLLGALLIGLVLLILVFYRFNFQGSVPYFKDLLTQRTARIADTYEQVERALTDTRRLHDDYALRLKQIEVEARQRIEAAVQEADAARTEIIADAQQLAAQVRRRSEEELSRERIRQRILLRRQIVQISLDAAEQSVRAHSDEKVQHQLISDFIAGAATTTTGSQRGA